MYGLPVGFDGSFLIGRSVRTVAFSASMTELVFDENVSIGLFASYEYRLLGDGEFVELRRVDVPVTKSRLMQLLGHTVVAVDVEGEGTLTLHFDSGHVFRCFDDACGYESYTIGHGDGQIIV